MQALDPASAGTVAMPDAQVKAEDARPEGRQALLTPSDSLGDFNLDAGSDDYFGAQDHFVPPAMAEEHAVSTRYRAAEVLMDPVFDFEDDCNKAPTYLENWNFFEAVRHRIDARKAEIVAAMEQEKRDLARQREQLKAEKLGLLQLINDNDPDVEERRQRVDEHGVWPLTPGQCQMLLHQLMQHQFAQAYFLIPVDPALLPDYPRFIAHPMDLGTIKTRMDQGKYATDTDLFIADVRLIFKNAYTFNPPTYDVVLLAQKLEAFFEDLIRNPHKIDAKAKIRKSSSSIRVSGGGGGSARPSSRKRAATSTSAAFSPIPASIIPADDDELGVLVISHAQKFCNALKANPALIHRPHLAFFREFLESFDYH